MLQSKLPLDVSVLQQPMLPLFYSRLCCLDVYVNQEPMLPLEESVLKQPVLPGRAVPEDGLQQLVVHLECLSTSASAAPRRVCLQKLLFAPEVSADCIEPVLHLSVSFYKRSVLHLEVSVFKSMCCTQCCGSGSGIWDPVPF